MTAELVETALNLELEGGAVVADDLEGRRCVFLAALYRAEREIAEKVKTLAAGKPPWPAIDVDKAIPWVEQRTKLSLADSQKAALRVALLSNVTVITGGPGVIRRCRCGEREREDPQIRAVRFFVTPDHLGIRRASQHLGPKSCPQRLPGIISRVSSP